MVLRVIKHWDNNNWLASREYINQINNFILKQSRLKKTSNVLDIGCGRGKIIGNLYFQLNLINKPVGIDLINHKDKHKKIDFKKIDGLSYFKKNKKKFDLILIKQTIHLFKLNRINKLIKCCKRSLNKNGVILIFTLDPYKNEMPSFKLMKQELYKSFQKDKMITKLLIKSKTKKNFKKFSYEVKIDKVKYLKMLKKRFISILLTMSDKEILNGIKEIKSQFKTTLKFNDNLICIILKK